MWGTRRQRALAGAGAGVVVVAAATLGVRGCAASGPDRLADIGGPLAAARTADHRPHGPDLRDAPYDCGLSRATLMRVAGADKREMQQPGRDTCTWDHAGPVGGELEIELDLGSDASGRASPADALESAGRMADTAVRSTIEKAGPITDLSGLGDTAVAWISVEESGDTRPGARLWRGTAGTTVVFTAGNVAARVSYGGSDRSKDGVDPSADPLPDKKTRDVAFSLATEVARAVGARTSGTPAVAAPPAGTPVRTLPAACALIAKAGMNDALGGPATAKDEEGYLFRGGSADAVPDVSADGCEWWSDRLGANADVEWALVAGDGAEGPGASVAAREFARQYLGARDTPGGRPREAIFTPLKGLGDEAFAAYEKDDITGGGSGSVVVRVRNALVKVRCWDTDAYAADDAMNCAYKAARAAAKRVGA